MTKQAKGAPTKLNIWTMDRLFGSFSDIPNQVDAVHMPALRKLLAAGYIEIVRDGKWLRRTEAGEQACDALRTR